MLSVSTRDGRIFTFNSMSEYLAWSGKDNCPDHVALDDRDDRNNRVVVGGKIGVWRIHREYVSRIWHAQDHLGEIRELPRGLLEYGMHQNFIQQFNFNSWAEFDQYDQKRRLSIAEEMIVELKEYNTSLIKRLDQVLVGVEDIRRINKRGGPGSRKAVNQIIEKLGQIQKPL